MISDVLMCYVKESVLIVLKGHGILGRTINWEAVQSTV